MLETIEKSKYNKIKKTLKENIPYTLYKTFYDIYEKNKEELLINTFFTYLCYLSEEEFYNLKNKIEIILKQKINYVYTKIPLFNNITNKKNGNVTTIIKPKIEFETLKEEEIIKMIEAQDNKFNIKTNSEIFL
jgi:hypothetical protein